MLCLIENAIKPQESPTNKNNIFEKHNNNNHRSLRDVFEEILTLKLQNSPIFSGDFGENIFKNSQYLIDMFKDLPYEPVVCSTINHCVDNFTTPYEIDNYFKLEENLDLQTHLTPSQ